MKPTKIKAVKIPKSSVPGEIKYFEIPGGTKCILVFNMSEVPPIQTQNETRLKLNEVLGGDKYVAFFLDQNSTLEMYEVENEKDK